MKAEIYQSLYTINESLQLVAEQIGKLKDAGILTPEFTELHRLTTEEIRAAINVSATNTLHTRENAEAYALGQERMKHQEMIKHVPEP